MNRPLAVTIVILFFLACTGVSVYLYRLPRKDVSLSSLSSIQTEPCPGKWYDSHVHANNKAFVEKLSTRMDEHSVGCALLLNVDTPPNNPQKARADFQAILYKQPGRFVPMFDVEDKALTDIRREQLQKVFTAIPQVKGLGESAFYQSPFKGTKLTDAPWPEVFALHNEKRAILMIHPVAGMGPDLETILAQYPNVTVIIHGPEIVNELPTLLSIPNLYYTLDTATLLTLNGTPAKRLLYPPAKENNKKTFIKTFDKNKQTILNQAATTWVPLIQKFPTKIMWGTDVSSAWHEEKEVYSRLMQFSSDFTAKLPEPIRKDYMRNNAFKVLGQGVTIIYDKSLDKYSTKD